jgi:hypothetical protein
MTTRAVRADDLDKLLGAGPSIDPADLAHLSGEEAAAETLRRWRLWSDTWVRPAVRSLVPELRKREEARRRAEMAELEPAILASRNAQNPA